MTSVASVEALLASSEGGRPNPPVNLVQSGALIMGPGARKEGNGMNTPLTPLSAEEQAAVAKAKKYAMEQSIKMVLMKQTLAHQQQQAKSLQRHQAIVLMCRVYVGSINFEVKEEMIRTAFLPFGPIKSISMSWDPLTQKHKGFAFVEYEMPEAANLSLEQMNGVLVSGRNIKVGRPSNMPQAQAIIDEIMREAENLNRIYVASIHPDLTEDDVRSVFEAFGDVVICQLSQTGIPGKHKGYGFVEYKTKQSAVDAISSMNLFDLGGQYLRVGKAITPPDQLGQAPPSAVPQQMPTAAAVAAAAATAKIQAMDAVATNLGVTLDKSDKDASQQSSSGSRFGAKASTVAPPSLVADIPIASTAPKPVVPPVVTVVPPPQVAAAAAAARAAPPPPMPSQPIAPPPPAPQASSSALAKAEELKRKQQEEDVARKKQSGNEMTTIMQQENLSIRGTEARQLVMQKLMREQRSSAVLLLKNMVSAEEVDEDLQEEIEEECGKFGSVERVIIYQERQSEADDAEIVVKIFVEFGASEGAQRARDALHCRFFGGRRVSATIYDQDLFDHNDLSG